GPYQSHHGGGHGSERPLRALPGDRGHARLDSRERGGQPRAEGAGDRRSLSGGRGRPAHAGAAAAAALHGHVRPKGPLQRPDAAHAGSRHHRARGPGRGGGVWAGEPAKPGLNKECVMSDVTHRVAEPVAGFTAAAADRKAHGSTYVVTLSAVAAIGGFLFGFDSGVINGTVEALANAFGTRAATTGLAVASALLGCAIGAFVAGRIADHYGRRPTMFLDASLFL